ncbi:MAG: hypothetical protein Q4C36_00485 [Coriobacteriia bacterium]|nr:hypothetical protein [Coriobacteriia bacterium]
MTFMFAIPLCLGAMPALGAWLVKARPVPVVARQSWALAIACLTVASCLHGIFDIAGTASAYLPVYVAAAMLLAVVGIAFAIRERVL